MSNSSSSSSSSSSDPKLLPNPKRNLKPKEKFQVPDSSAPIKSDTESGMPSIGSKPSIKLATKAPDYRPAPQIANKSSHNQLPVQHWRSIKHKSKRNSLSSPESQDSSYTKEFENQIKPKKNSKTVKSGFNDLKLVNLPSNPKKENKNYGMIANHFDLNDEIKPLIVSEVRVQGPDVIKLEYEEINTKLGNAGLEKVKFIGGGLEKQENLDIRQGFQVEKETGDNFDKRNSLRPEKFIGKDKISRRSNRSGDSSSSVPSRSEESSEISRSSSESAIYSDDSGKNENVYKQKSKIPPEFYNTEERIIWIANPPQEVKQDPSTRPKESNGVSSSEIQNPPFLLPSVQLLVYSQLSAFIYKSNHQKGSLFDSQTLCEKFCQCLKRFHPITSYQCQELLKLQKFCNETYDNNNGFHRYLFYSYYCRLGSRSEIIIDDNTAKLIGFSCADEKKNELRQKFTLCCLLHIIFLYERKPRFICILISARRNEDCTFINLCIILLRESFNLLKSRKINQIFTDGQDAIQAFFEFHSGLLNEWVQLSENEDFSESVREATSRAMRNPMLCRVWLNK